MPGRGERGPAFSCTDSAPRRDHLIFPPLLRIPTKVSTGQGTTQSTSNGGHRRRRHLHAARCFVSSQSLILSQAASIRFKYAHTTMTSTSDESDLKEAAAAPAPAQPDTNSQSQSPPSDPNDKEHHSHRLHLHHAHNDHHHGARVLKFIHPHTGRTTHVCHTPEELEKRRQDLSRQETKESLDFDLVLHGSPEHHDAIRDLHSHHKSQHDQLKEEHPEIFERFDHVRNELDILNAELHMLTDHSVALDASFDKFGYSAHLRTKDDSETSSLRSEHSNAAEKHQDRSAKPLKFFKRPVVRQYFHKGLLWRSARHGEVPSFELFIDLVYVGVIDIIGEKAVEHPNALSLLHFVIVFCIGWKIWSDMTNVINWFDIDDIFQRVCVAFYLVCLFGFTTNIFYMFEEDGNTYTSAVAFYIAQRMFLALWYLGVAKLVPMIRGTMISNSFLILTATAFWIGSIHVRWPGQLALIWIAICIDLFGGILLIGLVRHIKRNNSFTRWAKRVKIPVSPSSLPLHILTSYRSTSSLSPPSISNTASNATTPSSL